MAQIPGRSLDLTTGKCKMLEFCRLVLIRGMGGGVVAVNREHADAPTTPV